MRPSYFTHEPLEQINQPAHEPPFPEHADTRTKRRRVRFNHTKRAMKAPRKEKHHK